MCHPVDSKAPQDLRPRIFSLKNPARSYVIALTVIERWAGTVLMGIDSLGNSSCGRMPIPARFALGE